MLKLVKFLWPVMVSTLCVLYLHSVVAVRPDLRGVYDIAWVLAVLTTVLTLVLLFRR